MGTDMPTEHALLKRLQTMIPAPAPGASTKAARAPVLAISDDLSTCDLLVVPGSSAMARVGLRMAQTRPELAFWTLDDDGRLHDGRSSPPVELTDDDIRVVLVGGGNEPEGEHEREGDMLPIARVLRDRVVAGQGLATLVRNGRPQLLLDFDRSLAVPVAGIDDDVAAALAADFHQLRLGPLSIRDFDSSMSATPPLPLVPLLWNIALQVDAPVPLFDPMDRRTVLSLRQWPDFRALARRPDHFRLCCLLLKRPSTTVEACELLELDAATVDGFFNAAYLSGHADTGRHGHAVSPLAVAAAATRARPRKSGGSALARMWRSVRKSMQVGT
ncbi:hypothetical protein [Luteimonas sp. A537]